jgi:hypothetical protein
MTFGVGKQNFDYSDEYIKTPVDPALLNLLHPIHHSKAIASAYPQNISAHSPPHLAIPSQLRDPLLRIPLSHQTINIKTNSPCLPLPLPKLPTLRNPTAAPNPPPSPGPRKPRAIPEPPRPRTLLNHRAMPGLVRSLAPRNPGAVPDILPLVAHPVTSPIAGTAARGS